MAVQEGIAYWPHATTPNTRYTPEYSVDLVVFFESGEETTKLKDLKRYTEKQKKSLVIKT